MLLNRESIAIQSAVLDETLNLLAEAKAYLQRHSPVPMTLDLVRRIEGHLASPESKTSLRIARENATEIDLRKQARFGSSYNVVGLPVLEVMVNGDTVHVQMGKAFTAHGGSKVRNAQADEVLRLLEKGVSIDVSQVRPSVDNHKEDGRD